jgi:hypothetical protein
VTIGAYELAAATTGAVAAACAVVLLLAGPLRRWLPELAVVAMAVAMTVVGAWGQPAFVHGPALVGLVGLAGLGFGARALGATAPRSPRALAAAAALGGALFGGLPAAAVLVPSAPDGKSGARIALIAHAAGLLSPLGSPARLLVAWDVAATLALTPVALLGIASCWPWRAASTAAAPPPRSRPRAPLVALILASAALVSVLGPVGAAPLLAAPALVRDAPAAPRSPRAPWAGARLALAAWAIGAMVTLGGGAWWLARGLIGADHLVGPAPLVMAGVALGALGEPVVVASLARSASELVPDATAPARWLGIGLACSPLPTVALATWHHGRGALVTSATLAALQGAFACAWFVAAHQLSLFQVAHVFFARP